MSASQTVPRPIIWGLLLLNAVLLTAIFFLVPRTALRMRVPTAQTAGAPVLAETTPFLLTRETGEPFSSEQLKGDPWIASFLFTRCPGQCPMLSERLRALQTTLPPGASIVSFTVDPAYDTPERLDAYARRFSADASRWVFLTGEADALRTVRSELKLSASDEPGDHSLRFVLMDAAGRARGYYDSNDPADLKRLKKDLAGLGSES